MAFAHSRNADGHRHGLSDHLRAVSDLCAQFAEPLGAAELGRLLGLWHDLGKYAPAFQQYLLASEAECARRRRGPDHKAAGAMLAAQRLGALALLIQGHHGGLCSRSEFNAWLQERVAKGEAAEALLTARQAIPRLEESVDLRLPRRLEGAPLCADLFLRLLFSALVDADYLDTERHFALGRAEARGVPVALPALWGRFERAQRELSGRAGAVNEARHTIYQACLAAAEANPGLFRLTVPTGGGKTRSAMGFALRHALLHGQRRIIVAIPYISITEQTADVYRSIFEAGTTDSVVLEHHSGVTAPDDDEDIGPSAGLWSRLAAENWDAPIVVTTTVQLFESLYANTPAKVRKLHRLAESVIILDEAQSLPPHLLEAILDGLDQLARHYHTSIVFSTATQPALEAIPAFRELQTREIVPQPERFFAALERVRYEWRLEPPLSWPELADLLRRERQALVIVNTKKDALSLLEALSDPQAVHLSTLLCGAHRRRVLAEVHRRLRAGEPCRLVSTQVVEAGVDLDFPVVFRALGPLDSIIQAAGRCNREGRLDTGRVVVFKPAEGSLPGGAYRAATGITGALLGGGDVDPNAADAAHTYFARLFHTIDTDREGIQALRARLDFPEVAARFRMIDDDTMSVVVPYGSVTERRRVEGLLDALRGPAPDSRIIWRSLQPYIVNIRRREAQRYERVGLLAPVIPGLGEWLGRYDPICGVTGTDVSPDALIV